MALTTQQFQDILDDTSKRIVVDLNWNADEDHSPAMEFRVEIQSDAGYPLFLCASYNPLVPRLSFVIIHQGEGRVYALYLGKDHRNLDKSHVGEKHKHKWDDVTKVKNAYVPHDITESINSPVKVWKQFCAEARITHTGVLHEPPDVQSELFL